MGNAIIGAIVGAAAGVGAVGLTQRAVAQAGTPTATVTYAIDGAAPTTTLLLGSFAQNGNASFAGIIAPPGAGWQLQIAMSSDFNPNPNANLIGLVIFQNQTEATREVKVTVEVPICPALEGGSLVGGTSTLTLQSTDAGSFSCASSPAVLTFLANGAQVGVLFPCPFAISAGGSGTLSSNSQYGLPGPNVPGPTTLTTIGVRQHLTITGLDTAQVQFNYLLLDPPGIAPCEADLDGSGAIDGADLAYLFTVWGSSSSCPVPRPADLDNDGVVGASDLQLLLGAWGAPCP
jgi:hypothetical protein